MQGIFSQLPPDTLAAALSPIADHCEQLDWAVDLQSGPLRFPYYDENEPANVLSYHHAQAGLPMGWFRRGFLPRHADSLVMDEWSYYLGFPSETVSAADLVGRLAGDLNPRRRLFDAVARLNLLYLIRVDTGWWEAYTPDATLFDRLHDCWSGTIVNSDRWNGDGPAIYPIDHTSAT